MSVALETRLSFPTLERRWFRDRTPQAVAGSHVLESGELNQARYRIPAHLFRTGLGATVGGTLLPRVGGRYRVAFPTAEAAHDGLARVVCQFVRNETRPWEPAEYLRAYSAKERWALGEFVSTTVWWQSQRRGALERNYVVGRLT